MSLPMRGVIHWCHSIGLPPLERGGSVDADARSVVASATLTDWLAMVACEFCFPTRFTCR